MKNFRKFLVVVSLGAAVTLGAATNRAPITDGSQPAVSPYADADLVTLVIDFVVFYNRVSIPPG